MRKISKNLLFVLLIFSCQLEKDKQIARESEIIFEESLRQLKRNMIYVNVDSFTTVYEKYKSENPQQAMEFVIRFEGDIAKLVQKKKNELEMKRQIAQTNREQNRKKQEEDRVIWENSIYGKLQKKYPHWSDEDCKRVIDNKIWIGMSLEMLKYQRGNPNNVNPSNYGNGTQFQWCWNDYTPKCFYGGEDGIITAFN